MTEEIIIDGVNVAGCKYLNKVVNEEPYCNIDEEHLYTCSSDENCYFKELKRLERENRELKEEIQFHNRENSNLLAERNASQIGYDEIREVREQLRSALEEIREIAKDIIENDVYENSDVKAENILTKINEVLK